MRLPAFKKYPKKIYVKDEVYKVRMVKRIPGEVKTVNALCDGDKRVIWIRRSQSPSGLLRAFIHEALHALEFEYEIDIKHKTIHELEAAIAALMEDNF